MTGPEALQPSAGAGGNVALVVDLDGTLVSTDLLIESVLLLARRQPLSLLRLPLWLARGKAHLKRRIAERVVPDVDTLPYRGDLLAYLDAQKRDDRMLVLATASDEIVARKVADKLGLFDAVFASDGITNLSGPDKRARVVQTFGENGFDYAGNSRRDLPVWASARAAVLVDTGRGLTDAVSRISDVEKVFGKREPELRALSETIRPHHWLKNILLFVPLAASHEFGDAGLFLQAILAFIAFSLCASTVYVVNDLLDLPSDRHHPHKKDRPLAAGRLPVQHAVGLVPLLLIGAASTGLLLPPPFLAVMALYVLLMTAYSQRLKDIVILDVLILSAGYTLRVLGGAVAIDVVVSSWLLTFSVFMFFSLALTKRYSELVLMRSVEGARAHARAYVLKDSELIAALGVASGHVAVLVLALYISSATARALYRHYELIWIVCALLLYWISYLWLMAHRGRMQDDPLVFAIRNRVSLVLIILMSGILLIAV